MRAARSIAGALGALVLALASTVTATAPASADAQTYDDPIGDSTGVDISRVRLIHRDAVVVRVRSALPVATGQVYGFWFDVGHGPRPDYYVAFRANAGFDDAVGLVHSFGDHTPTSVSCPGLRARADIFAADKPVSLRIPRDCLGNPGSVRVAVQFEGDDEGTVDWSVGRRGFGPWVSR